MTRAAIFAQLVLCALGCNRLDQSRAKTTASRLESKHLAEVRHAADDLEKACGPLVSIDGPAIVQIQVSCRDSRGAMLLRSGNPNNGGFFEVGIGKDADAGLNAGAATEETVRVPSTIAADANDICINRPAVGICVAYRD
jgi:hypothetical protein